MDHWYERLDVVEERRKALLREARQRHLGRSASSARNLRVNPVAVLAAQVGQWINRRRRPQPVAHPFNLAKE